MSTTTMTTTFVNAITTTTTSATATSSSSISGTNAAVHSSLDTKKKAHESIPTTTTSATSSKSNLNDNDSTKSETKIKQTAPPSTTTTTSTTSLSLSPTKNKQNKQNNTQNKQQQSPPPLCSMCQKVQAIYNCPKCHLKTCSLPCCLQHKQKYQCNGKRDKTQFLYVKDMSDQTLQSDYFFLEDCGRIMDIAKRGALVGEGGEKKKGRDCGRGRKRPASATTTGAGGGGDTEAGEEVPQPILLQMATNNKSSFASPPSNPTSFQHNTQNTQNLDFKQKRLVNKAAEIPHRQIKLLFMPLGMSRRTSNTTSFHTKKDEITWCIELKLHWYVHVNTRNDSRGKAGHEQQQEAAAGTIQAAGTCSITKKRMKKSMTLLTKCSEHAMLLQEVHKVLSRTLTHALKQEQKNKKRKTMSASFVSKEEEHEDENDKDKDKEEDVLQRFVHALPPLDEEEHMADLAHVNPAKSKQEDPGMQPAKATTASNSIHDASSTHDSNVDTTTNHKNNTQTPQNQHQLQQLQAQVYMKKIPSVAPHVYLPLPWKASIQEVLRGQTVIEYPTLELVLWNKGQAYEEDMVKKDFATVVQEVS